jgi:hypothetical protein
MIKTPDLAGALQAMKAASRGPRKKSPIYAWLEVRYDDLSAAFRKDPPSWKNLARYLAEGGITNADGQTPTAAAVRTSWLRLEADIARKRSRSGRSRPPADQPPAKTEAPAPPPAPNLPAIQPDPLPRASGFDFEASRPVVSRSRPPKPTEE